MDSDTGLVKLDIIAVYVNTKSPDLAGLYNSVANFSNITYRLIQTCRRVLQTSRNRTYRSKETISQMLTFSFPPENPVLLNYLVVFTLGPLILKESNRKGLFWVSSSTQMSDNHGNSYAREGNTQDSRVWSGNQRGAVFIVRLPEKQS